MPLKMKDLPESERPYEKLRLYGEEKLSNSELLAIIIKSGTKDENSIDIANRVLAMTDNLYEIKYVSIEELIKIKGIGYVKAIQLKAMCELTSRMSKNSRKINKIIKNPKEVAELLMEEMKYKKREEIKAIILNSKNMVVKISDVAYGDSKNANVSIKQILHDNIKMQEPKIILVHNHPSGDPTPSESDFNLTVKLMEACELMGIELLDHIVLGNNKYESIMSLLARNTERKTI